MPIYRVLKTLSKGMDKIIQIGEFTDLIWLDEDQQERLIRVGAVSRITAPPLSKIPGWTLRCEKLAPLGITEFETFLEADPNWLAEQLQVRDRTINKWRDELFDWLKPPKGGNRPKR